MVAQEVGSLAQMSGTAAVEIAQIVKASVKDAREVAQENRKRVEEGYRYVDEAAKVFAKVESSSVSVADNSSKVLTASQELKRASGQIGESISQLEQVTQENAASTEELAGQAEQLKSQVDNLNTIVKVATILSMLSLITLNSNSMRKSIMDTLKVLTRELIKIMFINLKPKRNKKQSKWVGLLNLQRLKRLLVQS